MLPTQQSVYLTGKGVQVSREKEGAGSTGRMHGGEGCSVPGCSHAMWALSSCTDRAAPSGSGGCPVLRKRFSRIPDWNSLSSVVTPKLSPDIASSPLGHKTTPR